MDLSRLLEQLGDVAGTMPADTASDDVWQAWVAGGEFEAMVTGMVGRAWQPRDQAYVAQLRRALETPELHAVLGDRFGTAAALVQALADRRP